jgi:hypothetical protein
MQTYLFVGSGLLNTNATSLSWLSLFDFRFVETLAGGTRCPLRMSPYAKVTMNLLLPLSYLAGTLLVSVIYASCCFPQRWRDALGATVVRSSSAPSFVPLPLLRLTSFSFSLFSLFCRRTSTIR